MQLLKIFSDGSYLKYCHDSKGGDVHLCLKEGNPAPLEQEDDFPKLKALLGKYTPQKIYGDFMKIYTYTSKLLDEEILGAQIDAAAGTYQMEDRLFLSKFFSLAYLTMVRQEMERCGGLGKRKTRLQIYMLLFLGSGKKELRALFQKPEEEIAALCQKYGI